MNRIETLAEGIVCYLGDCREILLLLGRVDAVVTDPPYGIDAARKRGSERFGWRDYGIDGWDADRVPEDLMKAVLSVSPTVVVWGGNYYIDWLKPGTKWLVWDKGQSDFSLADCELAWCSFDGAIRRLAVARAVAMKDGKEHSTQKLLDVMRWCIALLPPPCDKHSRSVYGERNNRCRRRSARPEIHRHRARRILFQHRLPPHPSRTRRPRYVHRAPQACKAGILGRALGQAVLQIRGRGMRNHQPRPWSPSETSRCMDMHWHGRKNVDIAAELGRTTESVRGRIAWVTMTDEDRERRRQRIQEAKRAKVLARGPQRRPQPLRLRAA